MLLVHMRNTWLLQLPSCSCRNVLRDDFHILKTKMDRYLKKTDLCPLSDDRNCLADTNDVPHAALWQGCKFCMFWVLIYQLA